MESSNQRLQLFAYGHWDSPEKADLGKERILQSLRNPEDAKLPGMVHLGLAVQHACELAPWSKDAPCDIDRNGISSILAKDVANLNAADIKTMLAIYGPVK